MITCLFVGGILACEIVKVVAIAKAAKIIKNIFTADETEAENN